MDDLSGKEIRGYRLVERIGAGGMGAVYKAVQSSVDRQVAIKVILPEFASHPEFVDRFDAEARMVAKLEHPHIVPLYDYWREQASACLVMRWLPGKSLRDVLVEGALELEVTGRLLEQIVPALNAAHKQGVVHRDLKPENILLDEDGNAYLGDFGIAKDLGGDRLTQTGMIVGSVDYLSPEQARGEPVTPKSDIYGLGVLLYEMLVGTHPFPELTTIQMLQKHLHEPLPSIVASHPQLPEEIDEIVKIATAKDPAKRYSSALDFLEAYRQVLAQAKVPPSERVELPAFLREDAEARQVERPVFVSHERDLVKLEEYLETSLSGRGQVVFVTGGAGRGKTALINEFCWHAQEKHTDLIIVKGNCNAHTGLGDPYLPFRDVMAMLSGDVEGLWAAGGISQSHARQLWELMPRTIDALLARGTSLIDVFVPGEALFTRVRNATPDETNRLRKLKELVDRKKTGSGELEQTLIFEQFTSVVQTLAKDRPLVLVLDDMQWADHASLDLLFHLGRRIEGYPILILCAYRPEELAAGRGQDRHPLEDVVNELKRLYGDVVVDLSQKDDELGGAFIEAYLDTEPNKLSPDFREALKAHTGGHPLFTIELIRAMQDRGDLYKDEEGHWVENPDLSWDQLPARVEAVIEARLNRLEEDLRELLSVASVEGEDFTAQVVARVQEIKERRLLRELSQELEKRHRLVHEQAELQINGHLLSRFRFAHQLYQRYLYNDLAAGEKRLLHAEIGAALEELFEDDVDKVAVQLAVHYSQAGNKQKALHFLTKAGHQARARYAHQEAINYFTQALALIPEGHPDRFDLLYARAKALELAGRFAEQLDDARAMLALANVQNDDGWRCDALTIQADGHINSEIISAGEPAQRAVEIARKMGDKKREAHALSRLGHYEWHRDRLNQSKEALELAVKLFDEVVSPRETASCLHMLSVTLGSLNEIEAAFAAVKRSIELSQEAGDSVQEATGLRRIAIVYINQEKHAEALPYAEKALKLHREIGDRGEEVNALNVLGIIYAWMNEPQKSKEYFFETLKLGYEIGHGFGIRAAIINLGGLHFRPEANFEDWLTFLDTHAARALQDEDELRIAYTNAIKAGVLYWCGQYEEGLALMRLNLQELGDLASPWELAQMHSYMSYVHAEMGEFDQAWESYETALKVSKESGVKIMETTRTYDRALIAWLQGDGEEMEESLEDLMTGKEELKKMNASIDLNDWQEMAARIYVALGDYKSALKYTTEMLEVMEFVPAPHEPQIKHYTHAMALYGLGRDREADQYLNMARERVMSVAGNIKDDELRSSWLENVKLNQEILKTCAQRGIPGSAVNPKGP